MVKVSIITPTYNSEFYLSGVLECIKNQTYKNIEYIVIDGKSTDATLDILKSQGNIINKLISEKDNGISDAFNKGVKLATGEIIGIINSDDYYNTETVQQVVDFYIQNGKKSGIYYGDIRFFDDESSYINKADLSKIWKFMSLHHPSMFITADVYEKIGLYSEEYKYTMDAELIHRALKQNVEFFYIDKSLANFRLNGTSGANYFNTFNEFYKSVRKYNNEGLITDFWYHWALFKKRVAATKIGRFFYNRKTLIAPFLSSKIEKG